MFLLETFKRFVLISSKAIPVAAAVAAAVVLTLASEGRDNTD